MKKLSFLTKMLAGIATLALALALPLSLTGCGGSDSEEAAIKAALEEVLANFKDPTQENLREYVEMSEEAEELEASGIDIYEFLGHCFKHFDYSIGEVTIDKGSDTASVDVTLTNANIEQIVNDTIDAIPEEELAQHMTGETQEEQFASAMSWMFEQVYVEIDAATETISTDATLTLTKTDGEWEVDEASLDEVVSAMYGGMSI